jgi:cytochrome P450 family 6
MYHSRQILEGLYCCILSIINTEYLNEVFTYSTSYIFRPAIVIRDPDIIKHILMKDFNNFADRHSSASEGDTLGTQNLFTLNGATWKYLRAKLSPAFTSGRMKKMFPLIKSCATELVDYLLDHSEDREPIEVKETTAKYATDVISTCAFGIVSNSLKDHKAEFREFGRKVFHFTRFRTLEVLAFFFVPSLMSFIRGHLFTREATKFFRRAFCDAINYRESSKTTRDDFLDLLVELKNAESVVDNAAEEKNGLRKDKSSSLFGKLYKK